MTLVENTTPIADIAPRVQAARHSYEQGVTKPYQWRVATLKQIGRAHV